MAQPPDKAFAISNPGDENGATSVAILVNNNPQQPPMNGPGQPGGPPNFHGQFPPPQPGQQGWQQAQISPRWVPYGYVPVQPRMVPVMRSDMVLVNLVQRASTVKFLAVIDMIFCAFMINPIAVLLMIMPCLGYWGATNFNRGCVYAYCVYLMLLTLLRILIAILSIKAGEQLPAMVNIFCACVSLFIFKFVIRFANDIGKLSPMQLYRVRCIANGGNYGYQTML